MADERVVYSDGFLPPPSPGTMCTAEEGKTRQSDKDAADINITIKKYNLQPLEMQPGWSGKMGEFVDFSSIPSYQEALNAVARGKEVYDQLAPEVRQEFQSAAVFLDSWDLAMAGDAGLVDRFIELGLLERPAEPVAEVPGPTA